MIYKCLHLSNYWNLFHYLIYLKKHVLIFCLKWLQVLLLGEGIAENRACIVEGRGLFPPILIYLECQKNTLSEQIIGQAMLFFICSRKKKKKRLLGSLNYEFHTIPGLPNLLATLHFLILFNILWRLHFFIHYL